MFCYNCGKELNDDFNLCPYCGADITRYSDETADKAKEYIVEPDVKFELLGRELFFSPRFLEYNTLRKRFFEKAESLEEEYIKFYKSRKHTFVGLFDEEIPEVVQKVTSAVRFGVDVLMEYGIDDIDDTMLANMVVQSGNIKESLGYIYAKAGEIQRYAENLGDYRDIKKASRGHWEGGGFGVTGAVKGAIVAGAFNIGAGAFHGIGDTLTKASDKAKISGMKQELAIDPRVATCLFDTVYDFSTKVFYCVEKLLIENDLIDEYDFDEAAANARAKNYIARIASQASAENVEKAIDILCDCIQQAPYSTILYVHLYNLFTGRKSDIHSAAKFFGNERNYKLSLLSADKKIVDSIKTEPEKTVEEIRKKIESYETLARDNPYLNVATYVKALEKKAIEIEKEAERTSKAQALEKQIKGKQKEHPDTIFCIDEPEAHMHTALQEKLLGELYTLIGANGQLWIATHSLGMLNKAKELEAECPGSVAFLNFDGFDFDDVVQIMPSPVSHNLWNRILSLTLENYSTLLAPETVVFCEGTTRGRKRKDFDAKCYANIFSTTHPSTVFYSLGGCNDIEEDKLKVIGLTQAIVPNTNVIRIIDRDDRSENEVEELSEKGIKVLDRRHLESYLLDDEIIKKWCATVGKAELENSALTIKQQAINASISRGNATDDIKSASNDIVTNIKKLLGLTACGNNGEAIIRDTITPLITPDTQVYQQLERLIFG